MLSRNAEPFFVPAVSVVSAQASLLTMDLGNAARQCQLGLDEGTDHSANACTNQDNARKAKSQSESGYTDRRRSEQNSYL